MNSTPVPSSFSRIVLTHGPTFWLGLIAAISLIEAPLKFQAPGITIPLGLGIGRLVFGAMNIFECVLAIVLLVAVFRAGVPKPVKNLLLTAVAILVVKVALIRPFLNKRTDEVLAGVSDGGSMLHYFYIAADGALIVLLIALIIQTSKAWLRPRTLVTH